MNKKILTILGIILILSTTSVIYASNDLKVITEGTYDEKYYNEHFKDLDYNKTADQTHVDYVKINGIIQTSADGVYILQDGDINKRVSCEEWPKIVKDGDNVTFYGTILGKKLIILEAVQYND